MFQAFVITLREGIEAFLIIAISLAYLRKTGRRELIPAIHWGIGTSILLSIGAGLLLAQARNQALWEGILAIVAAFLVASLTVHMWRAGRYMKREIEGKLAASSVKTGRGRRGVFFSRSGSREGMKRDADERLLFMCARSYHGAPLWARGSPVHRLPVSRTATA